METPNLNKPPHSRGLPGELPDHYSVSQISTYLRCPAQYSFAYVDKIKSKPSFALDLGKSVHAAIEKNFIQKIDTGKDIHVDEVLLAYQESVKSYQDIAKNSTTPQEFAEYKEAKRKDETIGHDALEMYHKTIAPRIQPIMVEKSFSLDLGLGKPLIGFIDVVEKGGEIFADTKTSAKKYNQFRTDTDLQLSTYFLALKDMGFHPRLARFDVLVKKKVPEMQQIVTRRTKADLDGTVDLIRSVSEDITRNYNQGYFRPTPDAQRCGWCGYSSICPAVKGKIIKE